MSDRLSCTVTVDADETIGPGRMVNGAEHCCLMASEFTCALIIASAILVFARVGEEFHSFSIIGLIEMSLAAIFGTYVLWSILRRK